MPIIGKVGNRSFKVKFLNTSIHTILLIGSITMIYPFLIMLSASFKSNVDSKYFDIIPKYFHDDQMLYKKYTESRFNEEVLQFTAQYKNKYFSFDYLQFPENENSTLNNDWKEFLKENEQNYDEFDYAISEQFSRGVYTRNERAFRDKMTDEFDGDLEKFNTRYGISSPTWEDVREESKDILSRKFTSEKVGMMVAYDKFRTELEDWHKIYLSLDGHFISNELIPAYRNKLDLLNKELGTDYTSWDNIVLSKTLPDGKLKDHWIHYVKKNLNVHHILLDSLGLENYRSYLKEKYVTVKMLNDTWQTDFSTYDEISAENAYTHGSSLLDYIFFIENQAQPENLKISSIEFDFRDWLQNKYPDISNVNTKYSNGFKAFSEIKLSSVYPESNLMLQNDWNLFIRSIDDLSSLELSMSCQYEYLEFLKIKFHRAGKLDLQQLNNSLGTNYDKEINIYPAKKLPANEKQAKYWNEFVRNYVNPKFITVTKDLNSSWQKYLTEKHGDIETLNETYNLKFKNFENISIDFQYLDYHIFKEHKSDIFWEFVKRNYVMIIDAMLFNGRAIVNTLIYCLLAILTAVIVNPLAAYAMSRFKLKANYKIILVLMLTMAFPPMVMGIPNFLILKNMSLLNTFWALILPGAADGYFIFLLKGFFDSLPKELFESATVDGAGEVKIFTKIAMSLSKPIMAVIALGAFNAAYRNFMFAFIVCQDQSMWTMMVHIYQITQRSSSGVGYAALVIAAIPTFAVFIFFQNIIIKGIVVPTEK
ncbi:MAG: ABC transporter permease subunit [Candidatus Delongbacteria bacterium]|nr:ABC transporter permease subunit [Candidatus Delongbacteria bacterium]